MVVRWDHPAVQRQTREIVKALAEEFAKQGMYKSMATKRITLKGKAEWCKVWAHQLDTEFVDNSKGPDPRGGNYSTQIILDDDSLKLFNALGARAKLKDGKLTLRRYERHPVLGELGLVSVEGVDENTPIGNGSDISVEVDVYDYTFNGRASRGMRLVSLTVDKLVEYEKPAVAKPAVGVPAH
jgi:hypothetical protein